MTIPEWADLELSKRLPELRARGESQELEYMASFPENVRELAKEIAAFATSNPGTIILGVSDDGELLGLKEAETPQGRDSVLRRLQGICSGVVKPAIIPSARFAVDGGRPLLVLSVPRGSQPVYYCHEKPYLRNITESRPAQPHEVVELVREWIVSTAQAGPSEDEHRSRFLSSLASTLVDILIFAAEAEERSINPWFEMWRAQLAQAARDLRELAAEDAAQDPSLQQHIATLAEHLDDVGAFRPYIGCGPALESLVAKVLSAASSVKAKYIDSVPVDETSRSQARGSIAKLVRRLDDLSDRADLLAERGNLDQLKAGASEVGYQLLRMAAYAGVLTPEETIGIKDVGRKLHLLETIDILPDGGQSVAAVLHTVSSAAETLRQIVEDIL
jgi:hypothetical protein